MGSVIKVIQFLAPENCALSIVEGNSEDGTDAVLAALKPLLDKRIEVHFLLSNSIAPIYKSGVSRFQKLAELRNLALKPMLQKPERYMDSTVIFLNDVAICPDDILELVHQRVILDADMTCAMDWINPDPAIFYDIYISRAINGDIFFDIPLDGSWARAKELFWNEPETKERFDAKDPFQVFACWNGGVVFTAEPFVKKQVEFRGPRLELGECMKGETELVCKDLVCLFQSHSAQSSKDFTLVQSPKIRLSLKTGIYRSQSQDRLVIT
jgi:alpha-1,3-mannosyltransferase